MKRNLPEERREARVVLHEGSKRPRSGTNNGLGGAKRRSGPWDAPICRAENVRDLYQLREARGEKKQLRGIDFQPCGLV